MFTILIVSFDAREWQPANLIDYPSRAVLVGQLSKLAPQVADQYDDVDKAIATMRFLNQIYHQSLPMLVMMTGLARWAIVMPAAEADEVLALPKGQWFSMTYAEEVEAHAMNRVEHMAAPEYCDKFSMN